MRKIGKWKAPLNPGHYNKMLESFHKETDRGAALLAGSFFERYLKDFLRRFLVKDAIVDELSDGPFAPLSTFSACAKFCFAMGLISKDFFQDLEIIRKVRNHFAHYPMETSFGQHDVKELCSELRMSKRLREYQSAGGRRYGSREAYLLSIGISIGKMQKFSLACKRVLTGQKPSDPVPSDLLNALRVQQASSNAPNGVQNDPASR